MTPPGKSIVVLDSTPLGLLAKRPGVSDGDQCREWLAGHVPAGVRFYVPEIVVYEVRRELLRLGVATSLAILDRFVLAEADRLLILTSMGLRRAAEPWAQVRRQTARPPPHLPSTWM